MGKDEETADGTARERALRARRFRRRDLLDICFGCGQLAFSCGGSRMSYKVREAAAITLLILLGVFNISSAIQNVY